MIDEGCLRLTPDLVCDAMNPIGQDDDWGPSVRTLANPAPGSGGSLVFVVVAPGPGFDVGGEQWVNPGGVAPIVDFEQGAGSFVHRIRVWIVDEAGQTNFQVGYQTVNPTVSFTNQSAWVVALDDTVDPGAISISGPTIDSPTRANPDYGAVATQPGWLVLAIGAGQNDDVLTAGPGGYAPVFNNTTGPGDRRLLAVHSNTAAGTSEDPGPATWVGSSAAHTTLTLGVHCEPPPASACTLIPNSQILAQVDPNDPLTWGPNRTVGQLISIGDRWNVGFNTGNIYGYSFDGAGEIHDFALDGSGDTLRLGARTVNGRLAVVMNHQWRNDGSYDESQETSGGQNNSTTYPGIDRTFFDGTRTQLSMIGADIQVGPNPDPLKYSITFFVEEWMFADDNTTMFEVHEPGFRFLSPLLTNVRGGQWRVSGRTSAGSGPLDYNTATNGSLSSVNLAAYNLPPVGTLVTLIYDFAIDRSGGSNYFRLYDSKIRN